MQSETNTSSGQWQAVRGPLSFPTPNPQPLTPSRVTRRAFTLTELLVVIAIIAVLAAMVSVGVMRALDTAKQTRIKTEVDQLDSAFKAYREKYGSFPPSDINITSALQFQKVQQHIARAFPRYDITKLPGDLQAAGITGRLRPDQALVFWLSGFSPDPANPFVTPGPVNPGDPVKGAQIVGGAPVNPMVKVAVPVFDFDPARLAVVRDTSPPVPGVNNAFGLIGSYFPQGTKTDATGAPYIYWDSQSLPMGGPSGPFPLPPNSAMWNVANPGFTNIPFPNAGGIRPYAFDVNGNGRLSDPADPTKLEPGDGWVNPDSFQIISAGMDGRYGALSASLSDPARIYPTGTSTDPTSAISYDIAGADDDNVTNFCPKARLGDSKP